MPVTPKPKLRRKTFVGIAIESTPGTAETLVDADYRILAQPGSEIQQNIEKVKRAPFGLSMGHLAGVPAEHLGAATVIVEVRGSGTQNVAPVWARFLQISGMSESGGILTPVSSIDDQVTGTINFWEDGLLKQLYGAVASPSFNYVAGRVATITFNCVGIWATPSDVATLPLPDHESTIPPRVASATFDVGGTVLNISKLDLNFNNVLGVRTTFETASALLHGYVADRSPEGSFDPEATNVADHDLFGQWLASNQFDLNQHIGTVAGNKVHIDAPLLEYMDPRESENNGLLRHETGFGLNESGSGSGDAFIAISFP